MLKDRKKSKQREASCLFCLLLCVILFIFLFCNNVAEGVIRLRAFFCYPSIITPRPPTHDTTISTFRTAMEVAYKYVVVQRWPLKTEEVVKKKLYNLD